MQNPLFTERSFLNKVLLRAVMKLSKLKISITLSRWKQNFENKKTTQCLSDPRRNINGFFPKNLEIYIIHTKNLLKIIRYTTLDKIVSHFRLMISCKKNCLTSCPII